MTQPNQVQLSDLGSIELALDPTTDQLIARIPLSDGRPGHHVPIPLDIRGLTILHDILKRRQELAQQSMRPKMGDKGALTAWQVEQLLKSYRGRVSRPEKKEPVKAKYDLGFELDFELDL